jgi:hypothetical protein
MMSPPARCADGPPLRSLTNDGSSGPAGSYHSMITLAHWPEATVANACP